MALHEYEVDGQTFLFDEEDPLLPKNAKRVSDDEVIHVHVEPEAEQVQDEPAEADAVTTPADADPEPVEAGYKRGRRKANKADAPEADK